MIDDAWATLAELITADDGHPNIGRDLKRHLIEAGFTDVRPAASFTSYTTAEDVGYISRVIENWFLSADVRASATAYGVATQQHLDNLEQALKRWISHPGAFGAVATLENLVLNPTLADLIGGVQSVTLGDDEARRRRTQKTVQERKAPPTFDVLIEIHTRHRFAVHPDVAAAVDGLLRGWSSSLEIRTRQEDGSITTEQLTDTGSAVQDNTATPTQGAQHRVLRIYPYGINRHRLEHAIHALDVPARVVDQPTYADAILTVRGQAKRQPKALRLLVERGMPLYALRSDTASQMEKFLRDHLSEEFPEDRAALAEAEAGVQRVIAQNEQCELSPQRARLRRLQHQVVKSYGLISHSEGEEPFRRLIVYPVGR